jgi:hypothetical protein
MQPFSENKASLAQVRIATESDWRLVRDLRLEAIRSAEYALASNLAYTLELDELYWQEWCVGPGRAIFLIVEEQEILGLAAVSTSNRDPSIAIFDALRGNPCHGPPRGPRRRIREPSQTWPCRTERTSQQESLQHAVRSTTHRLPNLRPIGPSMP